MGLDTMHKFGSVDVTEPGPNTVIPTPGSDAAQKLGCACPVIDNHYGEGMPHPDGPRFWMSGECHVHRGWEYVKGYKKTDIWNKDGSANRPKGVVRIYFCDDDGRPDKEPHDVESARGANYVRGLLALGGETGIAEARVWGRKVKAVGHEGGVMTVHLGARWV